MDAALRKTGSWPAGRLANASASASVPSERGTRTASTVASSGSTSASDGYWRFATERLADQPIVGRERDGVAVARETHLEERLGLRPDAPPPDAVARRHVPLPERGVGSLGTRHRVTWIVGALERALPRTDGRREQPLEHRRLGRLERSPRRHQEERRVEPRPRVPADGGGPSSASTTGCVAAVSTPTVSASVAASGHCTGSATHAPGSAGTRAHSARVESARSGSAAGSSSTRVAQPSRAKSKRSALTPGKKRW